MLASTIDAEFQVHICALAEDIFSFKWHRQPFRFCERTLENVSYHSMWAHFLLQFYMHLLRIAIPYMPFCAICISSGDFISVEKHGFGCRSLSISLFFSHSLSHFVCNWFQVPEHIVASNCEIFSRMDKRRWFKPKGAHLNIVWMGETLDRPWPRHCMAYAQMVNREMFKRIESRSQPNAIVIVIEPFNVWTRAVSSLTSVIHLFFCHTQFHFERPASILCMCKRAIFPFSFFHFSFNLTIAFWLEPYRLHCTNTPA